MNKAFSSIKRGLLQALEHVEGHAAPQPDKQRFASVWDALENTPQEAASMKARSALRMAFEASREPENARNLLIFNDFQ